MTGCRRGRLKDESSACAKTELHRFMGRFHLSLVSVGLPLPCDPFSLTLKPSEENGATLLGALQEANPQRLRR